ncbi:MAG: chromosome segregation protein [Alphaproteobacteria bacterium]|jgi:chromosome segregation protein
MRLKKIRLAGFKSFVDPTNIPFPGDMTAIVGPNGCGKSNVIDAVRWVLGESSAKNLRGDAMTDVIFNGSSARKPVSQCSVELLFDNTSQRIQGEFAAYSEISVKRVVTKEAVSSYFLNASKCRRKDITDLFLGTGLGPRSYAIIEQGMISKLIESKPQELRVFIEEAAGISKYKERRKETLTRIRHTKENLDRLEDVRQELGEQIAKLKRQATAANRYKELKHQGRQLKAELATLKWLAQSHIMAESQSVIVEKQQILDNLLTSQQGDQTGLQVLKNQQSASKQAIDDLQQQIFTVGTEVTKVEQSQLFAKKRAGQIQSEIEQIKQSELSLFSALNGLLDEINQSEKKRLAVEPGKELMQEQLFELEDKKHDADARLDKQIRLAKEKEDAFYCKTQLLQQKHSQIQQTLSLQDRTETRLNELSEELASLTDIVLTQKLVQLTEQRSHIALSLTDQEKQLGTLNVQLNEANMQHQESLQMFEVKRNAATSVKAKLDALDALQMETLSKTNSELNKAQTEIDCVLDPLQQQPLWEFFQIEKGGEKMLNSVLKEMESAWVIDASLTSNNTKQWSHNIWQNTQQSLLFKQSFTRIKVPGSLASLITNEQIPQLFNHYHIANDYEHALTMVLALENTERVLTPDGNVYTQDIFIKPQQGDNKIARAAQITVLKKQYFDDEQASLHAKIIVEQTSSLLTQLQQDRNACNEQVTQNKQKQQATEITYQNMLFQQQQSAQRTQKIKIEINQHEDRLAQEGMSLEILNDDVEDVSEEVMHLEDAKGFALQDTDNLRTQQQQWQSQYNQMQSSLHAQSMLIQQIRNTLQILQEQQRNKQQQLDANKEKLSLLQLEAEDLLMPQDQQQEKLQILLTQQQELRVLQGHKNDELAKIDADMADIEKGQHGAVSKMDALKAEIESQRIRLESANVRAQSFIEQLTELQQPIKDVINTLPKDANEKLWQSELDKVSSSVQRLGAVNLAAVDEYEEQSKRKEHLDVQNLDINKALETLENAMRKIDKETRTRFKNTFEQVNSGLKSLFPKVFGGGMAYLELTDDDMLDTGVTIMARPPGKKNSTIGLLSGGEKALTALSLVFAIFRLNPAPFCLLDEVDAPLDDANVGRFCRLVSQMSESVQFIYITHNKVAMEMATHLTGVTMAEPGVSRMVAVDMEQALAIAE